MSNYRKLEINLHVVTEPTASFPFLISGILRKVHRYYEGDLSSAIIEIQQQQSAEEPHEFTTIWNNQDNPILGDKGVPLEEGKYWRVYISGANEEGSMKLILEIEE